MTIEVSDIIIIQSLEDHEFQTGVELADSLLPIQNPNGAQVRLFKVESTKDFIALVDQITKHTVDTRARPWLHVECHASPNNGLEFSNSSELDWSKFADKLRPLNLATGFNLLIGASACYGSYLAKAMNVMDPAPCYAVIGPTDVADPGELLGGFRSFYREILLNKNLDTALQALSGHSMSKGLFGMVTAEDWWESLNTDFLNEHFTSKEFELSVRQVYKRLKREGRNPHMGKLRRLHKQQVPKTLNRHFDDFFMIDSVDGSEERFAPARENLNRAIKAVISKLKNARRL